MNNEITQFTADQLKHLIKNNQLAQVLDILLYMTRGTSDDVYNEIIMHYAHFNEIRTAARLGVYDDARLDNRKNQLRARLLDLIDTLNQLGAFQNALLPNRKMITLTIEGDFTDYTPQMDEELVDFLMKKIQESMGNLTLKAAYRGSINLVIEGDEATIRTLMAQFEAANATNLFGLPNGMAITNVRTDNEAAIYEKIALCFYNLLLLESPDFEAARGVYKAMEKRGIAPNIDIFTHLIIKSLDFEAARDIYEAMEKRGIAPNIDIFTHLIRVIPDYQTALIWFNYMREKGIASNEALDDLMKEKNHAATYADTLQLQAVDGAVQKAAETGVIGLVQNALGYALSAQSAHVVEQHDELSVQLTMHIFDNLDKRATHEWPSYIWYSANKWVVQQGEESSIQVKKRLKTSKNAIFERHNDLVLSEVFIKDDYLMLNAFELTIVRHALGDTDYLMLEAHFREGKSYKSIAEAMDFAVSDVARRINLARKICQKFKNAGQN